MGYIAVAVPTGHSLSSLGFHEVNTSGLDELSIKLSVASDTVVHDDLGTRILGLNGLVLTSCHKVAYVLHAVEPFKKVMGGNVAVGHVAIVACGITAMRGMRPCSIVRSHDVAVHTGSRVVAGYVRVHPEQIEEQHAQTRDDTGQYEQSYLLRVTEAVFERFNLIQAHVAIQFEVFILPQNYKKKIKPLVKKLENISMVPFLTLPLLQCVSSVVTQSNICRPFGTIIMVKHMSANWTTYLTPISIFLQTDYIRYM